MIFSAIYDQIAFTILAIELIIWDVLQAYLQSIEPLLAASSNANRCQSLASQDKRRSLNLPQSAHGKLQVLSNSLN